MNFDMDYLIEKMMGIFFIFLICTFIAIIVIFSAWAVVKMANGFELTAEQKQDEALTQVCMLYHIDNKECFMVYGAVDNPYEPEK